MIVYDLEPPLEKDIDAPGVSFSSDEEEEVLAEGGTIELSGELNGQLSGQLSGLAAAAAAAAVPTISRSAPQALSQPQQQQLQPQEADLPPRNDAATDPVLLRALDANQIEDDRIVNTRHPRRKRIDFQTGDLVAF